MAEKDVVITYETLFELLRIEKNREDLQKLDSSFFDDVLRYLNDKRTKFESKESQSLLFAADEKEKARLELENIKKILKELYDKREKKIISMALNNARTGVALVNTANMLASERLLFSSVSGVLTEFRKGVLFRLASCEKPDLESISGILVSKLDSRLADALAGSGEQAAADVQDDDDLPKQMPLSASSQEPVRQGDSMSVSPAQPKELKTSPYFGDSGANTKKVRFLASIGEVVGPDLKIYGPYEEGAVISLPKELARVLLEKNQAEELLN